MTTAIIKDSMNQFANSPAPFPWYDSAWLATFVRARHFIERTSPDKYQRFVDAMEPLRTTSDFAITHIPDLLDEKTLREARDVITRLSSQEKERYEVFRFGRIVIHNHPFFNELQESFTAFVSKTVGEPVEPQYNFLSLYTHFGVCAVHMDAPDAKWTLDVCIEQSAEWPIHFSQVQPWPESFQARRDWQEQILNDPDNHFSAHTLREGEAIIFSGSSQWHYRELMPDAAANSFCHLVFFHYIPKGMKPLLIPQNWPELFDVPDLAPIVNPDHQGPGRR